MEKMQHFVLIKFKPGYMTEEKVCQIRSAFAEIKANINGIHQLQIEQNCVKRDTNMDLMIRLSLSDDSLLNIYLNHPAHIAIAKDMESYIEKRVSFDYQE